MNNPTMDQIGLAPYTESMKPVDFADINANIHHRGGNYCNSRPGVIGKRASKAPAKYTRCPKCGGKVIAPCIACNPESAYDPDVG